MCIRDSYDPETAEKAETEFNRIFVKKDLPDEIEEYAVPEGEKSESGIWIVKLMVLAGLAKSNGEARRLIKGGGVYLENEKITDEDFEIALPGEGILKVGKRRFLRYKG